MLDRTRRSATSRAALAALCLFPSAAIAETPEEACRAYASLAWKQARTNYDRKCGFSGPRWSFNTRDHVNWCLNVTKAQRDSEAQARIVALRGCRPVHWCETYSSRALFQAGENRKLGCGFGGARWSEDYEGHYEWCKRATREASGNEWQARNVAMNRCKAEKGVR